MTEEPTRKLLRSADERMIAGVCGGLAEYFNLDPVIVRLAFLLFTAAGGSGVLIYLVMLVVMPEAPVEKADE